MLRAAFAHLWLVDHPPLRRRQRAHCTRHRRHGAGAIGGQPAAVLQACPAQIRIERAAYYGILEATQKGDLDITAWIEWFLDCLDRAFDGAEVILASVLAKARFWERHAGSPLQDRQRLVINRLLDGFEGKLHLVEIRQAYQMLAGHGVPRH